MSLSTSSILRCYILIACVSLASALQAKGYQYIKSDEPMSERFTLHVNGLSEHLGVDDDAEVVEVHYGIGFDYRLGDISFGKDLAKKGEVFAIADFYRDSHDEFAFLFGVAGKTRLNEYFNGGLSLGLIHEEHIGDFLFPFLLPFVETRFSGPVNFRVTYVPPVREKGDHLVALQAIIKL